MQRSLSIEEPEIERLRDPDGDESIEEEEEEQPMNMNPELFAKTASELGRRLSLRSTKQDLVQKNIIKEGELNVAPGIIANKLALEKEKQQDKLNRKLASRPTAVDLKLRNILKTGSSDNVAGLQPSNSFESAKTQLKSCLKKRPEKEELTSHNILKSSDNVDPALAARQLSLKQSQLKDMLESKLRERPDPEELANKNIMFNETVEVYTTFKRTEYNRKPDENATFRKLTPQMKVQIREELNSFKKNEMEVAEESILTLFLCNRSAEHLFPLDTWPLALGTTAAAVALI